jgi:hypothetical protein
MATKQSPNLHMAEADTLFWKNNNYTKKIYSGSNTIYTGEVLRCNQFQLSGEDSEQLENIRSQFCIGH